MREDVLAGAGFTEKEHRRVGSADRFEHAEHFAHRERASPRISEGFFFRRENGERVTGLFEAKLDAETFVRIHRTTIVNLDRVRELRPLFQGGWIVVLRDGSELNASRAYADRLRERFAG